MKVCLSTGFPYSLHLYLTSKPLRVPAHLPHYKWHGSGDRLLNPKFTMTRAQPCLVRLWVTGLAIREKDSTTILSRPLRPQELPSPSISQVRGFLTFSMGNNPITETGTQAQLRGALVEQSFDYPTAKYVVDGVSGESPNRNHFVKRLLNSALQPDPNNQ